MTVVIAGIAISRFGLHGTGLAYCTAVAVLAAMALVTLFLQERARCWMSRRFRKV
jgi:O-antigen/teichoic acid export membrane protein